MQLHIDGTRYIISQRSVKPTKQHFKLYKQDGLGYVYLGVVSGPSGVTTKTLARWFLKQMDRINKERVSNENCNN